MLLLDMQRSLMLGSVSSFLHVGGYVVAVVVSLLLYYVTAIMDPGYVPVVNQVLLILVPAFWLLSPQQRNCTSDAPLIGFLTIIKEFFCLLKSV